MSLSVESPAVSSPAVDPAPPKMAEMAQIPAPALLAWLTLERLLYGVALIVAGWLHLYQLAAAPLLAQETLSAWPAWLRAMGLSGPAAGLSPDSPLLTTLQHLIFWLGGDGDGAARLPVALITTLMVLTPWLGRRQLGRPAALLMAFFLALDPWLLAFGRLGLGHGLSLTLALFLLFGLIRLRDGDISPLLQRSLAMAVGLLIISGPLAWHFALLLPLFAWLCLPGGIATLRSRFGTSANLSLMGGAALLGGSGWLSHLDSLGFMSQSIANWGAMLLGGGEEYNLAWPVLRLAVDNPFLLIMGLLGLYLLGRAGGEAVTERSDLLTGNVGWFRFLLIWVGWGLLLCLLPGRQPASLPLLGLPLLFAAIYGCGWLIERIHLTDQDAVDGWLLAATLSVVVVSGLFWTAAFINLQENLLAVYALMSLALALLLVVFFGLWSSWLVSGRVALLFLGAILFLATLSGSWRLNHPNHAMGLVGFYATTVYPEVRQLAADIQTLSAQQAGDEWELGVQIQMGSGPDPVLGWTLRRMRNLSWVLAPSIGQAGADILTVAITPLLPADDPQALPQGYLGSDYQIRQQWLPTDLPDLKSYLNWYLHRDAPDAPPRESILLWAPVGR